MTTEQFLEQEENFIKDIKNSQTYQKMMKTDKAISESQEIQELAKKRNDSFFQSTIVETTDEKHSLQIKSHEYNESIQSQDEVKEYMEAYKKIKEIVSYLNLSLLEEINHD